MIPNNGMKIGLVILVLAVAMAVALFIASRGDPSLRIAALVSVTGLITGLTGVASTLMIGRDITQKNSESTVTTNRDNGTTLTKSISSEATDEKAEPKV